MPPFKVNKIRLCGCGCGQLTTLFYEPNGRFKGYARGIPGHRRKQWSERTRTARAIFLERGREARRQPIGAKRLHMTRSTAYYVVKVAARGKWPYEHRIVMERIIGRQLTTGEHVHHRNGDTLDNRPANLELLTASAHARHHHTISGWSRLYMCCIACGETARTHASHGLCTRCYQRK